MPTSHSALRTPHSHIAGIVLCGGQSSRMGYPKARLPFGPELMLERMVRILGEAVAKIVVVAAADQELPKLPADVKIVRDERQARGPLEGLRAGLTALPAGFDAAYVTGCDVPQLLPAFVRQLIALYEQSGRMIAVPQALGYFHPLAAVYSSAVLPKIEGLMAANRPRPTFLFDAVPTRVVLPEVLTDVDPDLISLQNLNEPADYLAALAAAGFAPSPALPEHLRILQ